MTTPDPDTILPPLRGASTEQLVRFAAACRASAIVLDRTGFADRAQCLRHVARAVDDQARMPYPATLMRRAATRDEDALRGSVRLDLQPAG